VTPGRVLGAVAVSAVAGLVLGMLAVPTMALVGLTAKTSADNFMDLPTNLAVPPLPQASRILDAKGRTIATLTGDEDREVVKLNQVAPVMRQAIVDIEDSRFYTHHGLDFKGLARAFFTNQESGSVTQGGSTLTQQYVKNVLLENATTKAARAEATEQTVKRKLREARYALYLERHLSKDQILEDYLNIAYFGDGAYGIQAAARHYFNVPASDLTLVQSATLAGLVKNPSAYNPVMHPIAARNRRDTVLDRMHDLHHISTATWQASKASTMTLNRAASSVDSCTVSKAPFFCAYVKQSLLDDPRFGVNRQARERLLFEGGLTIRTSLDLVVQKTTDAAASSIMPVGNRIAAGVVVIQPGTGNVLAMSENRRYGASSDGKPSDQTSDSVHTKEIIPLVPDAFSPGSTFKVFTLTAALEQKLPLTTTFNAPPCYHSPTEKTGIQNPPNGCPTPAGPGYSNAEDGEGGIFSMTTATWNSVNTYYIQLEEKVGVTKVAEMARRLGVTSYRLAAKNVGSAEGSVTLGSHEASTMDMATAYATIAAHGLRCDPRPIASVSQRVGTTDRALPYTAPAPCRQVISAGVADKVSAVLQGVITRGTGTAAAVGRPAAGKTGTAEDFSDAWFVGYIPQLAAAVTVGDPRGTIKYKLGDEVGHANAYGGIFPARIWSKTIIAAVNALHLPVAAMPPPDDTQPVVPKVKLPDVVGTPYQLGEFVVGSAGFKVKLVQVDDKAAKGTIVKEDPAPGDHVPQDTEVTLSVSKGPGRGGAAGPTPTGPTPTGPTPTGPNPTRPNPGRGGPNPIAGRGGTPVR
jgi:membrane peptidoglycan carboxypeptidase